MYFESLQESLVANLRTRVRSGEFTERRLAHLAGISQPHINNVLKGERNLSTHLVDRILQALHMSVLDLLGSTAGLTGGHAGVLADFREVVVLEGRIGPGHPFPLRPSPSERMLFPISFLEKFVAPQLVRLGHDPKMTPILRENDLVMLDRSEARRTHPERGGLYLVNRYGQGAVRRLRIHARRLWMVAEDALERPADWEPIMASGEHIPDIVRAKLVWLGRDLEAVPI